MPIFEYNRGHCNYKFDKLVNRQDAQVNSPLCLVVYEFLLNVIYQHKGCNYVMAH